MRAAMCARKSWHQPAGESPVRGNRDEARRNNGRERHLLVDAVAYFGVRFNDESSVVQCRLRPRLGLRV
jgi:hypothetical protein